MKLLFSLASSCVLIASAQAVTVVYQNDFSTPTSGGFGFTESTDPQWVPGTGVYNNTITGDAASAATLSVAGVAGNSFSLQTVFTLPSIATGANFTVGFAALSNSAVSDFYLADVNAAGSLRLGAFNAGTFTAFTGTTLTGTAFNLVNGPTYTMTLTGTYDGAGALTLAYTLFNGTLTETLTSAPIATPKTTTFFGYRDRVNTAGSTVTMSFDSLSLTLVPEPSSVVIFGAGILGLAVRRRRC